MLNDWVSSALNNFDLMMLLCAVFFMTLNRLVTKGRVPGYEIIYRWLVLFSIGFTGIYAFILHAFFPELTANVIGGANSPFQFEVAVADLGFGLIGLLSFNASFGFRLAAVVANTVWLWGDAIGHLTQAVKYQDYSLANTGSWFWMDLILPFLLIICLIKLKPLKRLAR